ncbi:MAG: hypothetical protein ACR2RF_23630, partial [Geminicoccaceae bacterium]
QKIKAHWEENEKRDTAETLRQWCQTQTDFPSIGKVTISRMLAKWMSNEAMYEASATAPGTKNPWTQLSRTDKADHEQKIKAHWEENEKRDTAETLRQWCQTQTDFPSMSKDTTKNMLAAWRSNKMLYEASATAPGTENPWTQLSRTDKARFEQKIKAHWEENEKRDTAETLRQWCQTQPDFPSVSRTTIQSMLSRWKMHEASATAPGTGKPWQNLSMADKAHFEQKIKAHWEDKGEGHRIGSQQRLLEWCQAQTDLPIISRNTISRMLARWMSNEAMYEASATAPGTRKPWQKLSTADKVHIEQKIKEHWEDKGEGHRIGSQRLLEWCQGQTDFPIISLTTIQSMLSRWMSNEASPLTRRTIVL